MGNEFVEKNSLTKSSLTRCLSQNLKLDIFYRILNAFSVVLADKTFKNTVLGTHNMYRKRHAAAPLKWNSKLAKAAENAAQEAANTNTLRAIDMKDVGQNMIARSKGELPGEDVSSGWYAEENKYNYNAPGFSNATGKLFVPYYWCNEFLCHLVGNNTAKN